MKLPALKEIIEERREKAIESLSDSFAKNRLPLEEYERLVEYINKIESERELVLVEKIVAEYNQPETPVYDDDEYEDGPVYPHSSESSSNIAVLSSRTFSGPLKPGSDFVSVLGSAYVKIRKADLTRQQTVVNVVSVLGDITISLESGIRVRNRAIPILGSSSGSNKVNKMAQQSGPELVITGVAVLGNITVKLIKE